MKAPPRRREVPGGGHETAAVADGVGKTYASGTTALDGVSLSIESGSVTALVGSNGAGKSTLLMLLSGLLAPSTGAVRVFGLPAATRSLRSRVGYAAQVPALDPELTGRETLALFAALYGLLPRRREERVRELASAFGLGKWLGRRVGSYSGGLRQRLHLALGVVHEPELWLLDEPVAALDPAGRADFWGLVERQSEMGRTVVIVTHDLVDVAKRAQTVIILENGRILESGTPAELCAAHAKFGLELRMNLDSRNGSSLSTRSADLHAVAGERRLHVDGARVTLELQATSFEEAQREKQRTLDAFTGLGLSIVAYELLEPDLHAAYFRLTGRRLTGVSS
jgi:ABC-2 type transport system ATP-binding protein